MHSRDSPESTGCAMFLVLNFSYGLKAISIKEDRSTGYCVPPILSKVICHADRFVKTNSAVGGGMVASWNAIFFGLSFTPSGKETSQLSKIIANMTLSSIEAL